MTILKRDRRTTTRRSRHTGHSSRSSFWLCPSRTPSGQPRKSRTPPNFFKSRTMPYLPGCRHSHTPAVTPTASARDSKRVALQIRTHADTPQRGVVPHEGRCCQVRQIGVLCSIRVLGSDRSSGTAAGVPGQRACLVGRSGGGALGHSAKGRRRPRQRRGVDSKYMAAMV